MNMILGFLLWNPTLALLPFIVGYVSPKILKGKNIFSRIIGFAAGSIVALYIGTTSWGAFFGALHILDAWGFMGFICAAFLLSSGLMLRVYGSQSRRRSSF